MPLFYHARSVTNCVERGYFPAFSGKIRCMETTFISAEEAAEFDEFKRSRREAEIALLLKKAIVDASRRETDRHTLKMACDCAKKLGVYGVLVSPVHVGDARKFLSGSDVTTVCLVGGTGESLSAVKKTEAKRAAKQGAKELRLVLCYSAIAGGNAAYLKREIKKVRKAVKRCTLIVSLDDRSLSEDDVALGARAAAGAKADGVCVRGEAQLVLRTLTAGAGKLAVHCSGVENAAQFRTAVRAGATHVSSRMCEEIAEELYRAVEEGAAGQTKPDGGEPG